MTLHGINAGRDTATPQCPEDATGQDGAEQGCEGAPAQPPRSLLTCIRGAFPRHLPSLWQEPSRPGLGGMAERPPSVPRLAWLGWEEEEEGTEDAPAWQLDEVEEVQLLQAGEWLSWATGPVAAAGLAPSHPLWTSPAKEGKKGKGRSPWPGNGHAPSTGHPQPQPAGREMGVRVPSSPCPGAGPAWGAQGLAVFSSLSCSPSALLVLGLCQIQTGSCQKSRNMPRPSSTAAHRYPQPSPPGLGLVSLLSRAPPSGHSM